MATSGQRNPARPSPPDDASNSLPPTLTPFSDTGETIDGEAGTITHTIARTGPLARNLRVYQISSTQEYPPHGEEMGIAADADAEPYIAFRPLNSPSSILMPMRPPPRPPTSSRLARALERAIFRTLTSEERDARRELATLLLNSPHPNDDESSLPESLRDLTFPEVLSAIRIALAVYPELPRLPPREPFSMPHAPRTDLPPPPPVPALAVLTEVPEANWVEGMDERQRCPVSYEHCMEYSFPCGHALCRWCYEQVLKTTVMPGCPMCRARIF